MGDGRDLRAPHMVDQIIAYEGGEMDEGDTVAFFQDLINSGLAWTLQGSYGRMAADLIREGLCTAHKGDTPIKVRK